MYEATADTNALEQSSYLYNTGEDDLISMPFDTGNAHLKVSSTDTSPFSGFHNVLYGQYTDSLPIPVHYGNGLNATNQGGSNVDGMHHLGEPTPTASVEARNQDYGDSFLHTKTNDITLSKSTDSTIVNVHDFPSQLKNSLNGHGSSSGSPGIFSRDSKMSSTPELSQSQEPSQNPRSSGSSPVKNKPVELRARTSIPNALSWEEFARQCILAADSSRLNPFALHVGEYNLLREHITPAQVTIYLNIRNAILRLWTKNPLVCVSWEEAAGCAREPRYFNLAKVAYQWLMRNGYINFGCVDVPSPSAVLSRAKSKRQRTIIVIGAGMSGLGCARQLEGLFTQLGDQWIGDVEKKPKIIVLEARPRVGGRVYSHQFRNQANSSLPAGYRCTAEMGAQIVTGFEHGNPMNTIIRGQLGIPYHGLRDNTILYDHDGTVVDKAQDSLVERLYNDVLERASIYRNKPASLRTVEGDRNLMLFGRDPSDTGGTLISTLEHSDTLSNQSTNATSKIEEKPSTGVEKLAGRAYQLSAGFDPNVPAAEAAQAMGWLLKSGVSPSRNLELDTISKSTELPTLGQTMDDGIRQYQALLNITPKDLRLLNWHHANLEYANAVNVSQLSLSGWDQDLGNEFEGEHCEIIGGYQQVPRGLWQCPGKVDVRFNSVVRSIKYDSLNWANHKGVKIECQNGESFEADEVVITTPLGVLKDKTMQFDPPLPDWKQEVINRMGFGLLNKVILVYEKPFWESDRDMFGLLNEAERRSSLDQKDYTSQRGRFYLFWNCIKTSGRPTLVALMAGDAAHYAESSTNETLVREVTNRLKRMFAPSNVPRPIETIVTRWKKDPFARGSYSYVGPRTQAGDYDVMARPHGPLHFAGEATCGTHPATVHGAYLSGLRAAAEVVDSIFGPIKVIGSLVEKRAKTEHLASTPGGDPKRKLEFETAQQAIRNGQQRHDEDYEASIIGAILNEIGERPIKPGRAGLNPFLLYTKDFWHICKAECDKARKTATKDPNAKASKTEIRTALGKMWRNAAPEVKKPYLDQTQNARDASAANAAAFKSQVAAWDQDAARIRQEYIQSHPPPGGNHNVLDGKTAIESGGGKRLRRTVS